MLSIHSSENPGSFPGSCRTIWAKPLAESPSLSCILMICYHLSGKMVYYHFGWLLGMGNICCICWKKVLRTLGHASLRVTIQMSLKSNIGTTFISTENSCFLLANNEKHLTDGTFLCALAATTLKSKLKLNVAIISTSKADTTVSFFLVLISYFSLQFIITSLCVVFVSCLRIPCGESQDIWKGTKIQINHRKSSF